MINPARVADATDRAVEAFWAEVARRFPEATSGDFDPIATSNFEATCRAAVDYWVRSNTPDAEDEDRESEAVDLLAEMLGHEACSYTLKATTPEIAVHLALYANEGNLESCG